MHAERAEAPAVRGPECERLAPLLPLVSSHAIDSAEEVTIRAHVATCQWCRRVLTSYEQLDALVLRHIPASDAPRPLSLDEVLGRVASDKRRVPPRSMPPMAGSRLDRRNGWLSSLSALAAVLLIVALAATIFSSRGGSSAGPTRVAPTHTVPPALASKTIYLATDGAIYALRASDGALRWRYDAVDEAFHVPYRVTSLAVMDAMVITHAPARAVIALRSTDGKPLWRSILPGPDEVMEMHITAAKGTIFVSTHSAQVGASADDSVFALRASDGGIRWRFATEGAPLSAPVVNGETVYVGTSASIFALRVADGSVLWSTSLAGAHQREGFTAGAITGVAMAVDGDILYANVKREVNAQAARFEPTTYALRASTGEGLWSNGGDGTGGDALPQAFSPAIERGTLYIEAGAAVWALRNGPTNSPDIQWLHQMGTPVTGPVVSAGVVYACGWDGYTYALSTADGRELWRSMTQGGSGLSHPPAVANGVVFADGGGALYALDSSDGSVFWRYITHGNILLVSPLVSP